MSSGRRCGCKNASLFGPAIPSFLFACLLVGSLTAVNAIVAEVWVDATGGGSDGAGCGASVKTPCASIEGALFRNPSGPLTLYLADGSYPAPNLPLAGRGDVTISSLTAPLAPVPSVHLLCSPRCFDAACNGSTANASCSSATITLRGLELTGGNSSDPGGAILVDGPGLVLDHVRVSNCRGARGGAVSVEASASSLSISSSSFSNCSAFNDANSPAADGLGRGGALYLNSLALNSSISSSTFDSCSADGAGSLSVNFANLTISSSTFTRSSALTLGGLGGVLLAGLLESFVTNITMTNCTVEDAYSEDVGGFSVFLGNQLDMRDCLVANCSTPNAQGGGGLFAVGNVLTLSSSTFRSCSAPSAGCVLAASLLDFSDTTFDSCQAQGSAGALSLNANFPATFSRCRFLNNRASTGQGGAILSNYPMLIVNDSHFINNSAALEGGAVAISPDVGVTEYAFNGCVFDSCSSGTSGGAILSSGYSTTIVTVNTSEFRNCTANYGGAIRTLSGSFSISSSSFSGSSAVSGGGALDISDNTNMSISSSSFLGCLASFGGAILFEGGTPEEARYNLSVTDTLFGSNSATQLDGGGALFASDATISTSLSSCSFASNTAPEGSGGAVTFRGSSLLLRNSSFERNSALIQGGAMSLESGASASASSSTFSLNLCPSGSGGALSLSSSSSLHASSCSLSGNSASTGGAIAAISSSLHLLSFTSLSSNNASTSGGAISLLSSSNLSASTTSFSSNSASTDGGTILLSSSSASLTAVHCSGSYAGDRAGFAFLSGASSLSLLSSSLSSCVSQTLGGAVAALDSSILGATNSSFSNNLVLFGSGGAVYTAGPKAQLSLYRCSFDSNRAAVGGSLYLDVNTTGRVEGCKFTSNSALLLPNASSPGYYLSLLNLSRPDSSSSTNQSATSSIASAIVSSLGTAGASTLSTPVYLGSGGALLVVATGSSSSSSSSASSSSSYPSTSFNTTPSSSSLILLNNSFAGNQANQGGAIFLGANSPDPLFPTCVGCVDGGGNNATFGPFTATVVSQAILSANSTATTPSSSAAPLTSLLATNNVPAPTFSARLVDLNGNDVRVLSVAFCTITPSPNLAGRLVVPVARTQSGSSVCEWDRVVPLYHGGSSTASTANSSLTFNASLTISSSTGEFPDVSTSLSFSFCPAGSFVDSTSLSTSSSCSLCKVGYFCQAGQPTQPCASGTYTFSPGSTSPDNCSACSAGTSCSNGSFTVSYNYWVSLPDIANDSSAYQCNLQGCQGQSYSGSFPDGSAAEGENITASTSSSPGLCATGYNESRLCGRCAHDYYLLLGQCNKCTAAYKDAWVVLAILVIIAWIAVDIVSNMFESVDVILIEMQFLSIIAGFNNLQWFYNWILTFLKIFAVSLFDVDFLGPECVRGFYSYNNRWVVAACVPLVGIGLYALAFLYTEVKILVLKSYPRFPFLTGRPGPRAQRVRQTVGGVLNLLDILHINIVQRSFEVFQDAVYDEKVLAVDPTVLWSSSSHTDLYPFAVLYMIFYTFGFPIACSYILYSGHASNQLSKRTFLEPFGWMYDRYRPKHFWWYIPNILVRRLLVTGIGVFLTNQPDMQALLTLLLLMLTLCIHTAACPFHASSLNILSALLYFAQFLFILGGTANTYLVAPGGDLDPSVASALAGVGVATFAVVTLAIFPYESQGMWTRHKVRRWAAVYSDPKYGTRAVAKLAGEEGELRGSGMWRRSLSSGWGSRRKADGGSGGALGQGTSTAGSRMKRWASTFAKSFHGSNRSLEQGQRSQPSSLSSSSSRGAVQTKSWQLERTKSLREPVDSSNAMVMVPLHLVTDWFYPRMIFRFLSEAASSDLELLQRVRRAYTLDPPSAEEERAAKELLGTMSRAMQYVIVRVLVEMEEGGGDRDDEGFGFSRIESIKSRSGRSSRRSNSSRSSSEEGSSKGTSTEKPVQLFKPSNSGLGLSTMPIEEEEEGSEAETVTGDAKAGRNADGSAGAERSGSLKGAPAVGSLSTPRGVLRVPSSGPPTRKTGLNQTTMPRIREGSAMTPVAMAAAAAAAAAAAERGLSPGLGAASTKATVMSMEDYLALGRLLRQEQRRTRESAHLLLSSQALVGVVAWLLFRSGGCRRVFRDLLDVVRRTVLPESEQEKQLGKERKTEVENEEKVWEDVDASKEAEEAGEQGGSFSVQPPNLSKMSSDIKMWSMKQFR